jgi:hypothetical protein
MTEPLRPGHEPRPYGTDTETTVTTTPASAATPAADDPRVSTTPVIPPPGSDPRRASRGRWAVALGVVGLVAAGTVLAVVNLTGASPSATVTGYVPSDSVMYGEVRLDLPGDQRAEIGEFLSKFPGFADQAALDTKIDEVLDRLVQEGTDGEQTFTTDIKPWFDGEVAFAVGPLPVGAADGADPMAVAADARALVLLSIKDEALARAWFGDAMGEAGVTGTTQDHAGTSLTVFSDPEAPGVEAAFGIVGGKVAIAGDLDSVKAAIDTGGDSAFATSEDVAAAAGALEGDSIGFMFMDARAFLDTALDAAEGLASAPPMSDALLAQVPDWIAFRMRIEGDALLLDTAMQDVPTAPGPQANRANGVADWAPASTIFLAAGNDYGATLLDTVELYRQEPALEEVFTGIEQAAGMLGGLEGALGWMGDSAIVVSEGADSAEGGIVSVPADAAGARQFLTTIRSFATLAGGQMGIEVREEAYAGATITIVSLGSLQDLAGMAGGMGGVPVPVDPSSPLPEGDVELAYTATDDIVVIGSGPNFVKAVLDAGTGASLADDARYAGLVGRVGAEHTGVTFVDVAAVRGLLEGLLAEASADERAEYEESVKPFLEPFDAIVGAAVAGDVDTQRVIITVQE